MTPFDGAGAATVVEDAGWARLWRPAGLPGVLAMHARGRSFRCAPCGEYVVAHVDRGRMDIVRCGERYQLAPGELGLWSPGRSLGECVSTGGDWAARVLVIEQPGLTDPDGDLTVPVHDLELPGLVIRDRNRSRGFLRLHAILASPASALEHECALAEWLRQLAEVPPTGACQVDGRRLSARRDPALRTACQLLHDELAADVDLASLAVAAAVSRFRLIRLFKAGLGLPPHSYQVQLRVQRARALLEAGHAPAEVAQLVGFFDQSHLNRHFTPRLGLTPARYARAFQRTVSPARRALGPVAQVGRPLVAGQVAADQVA